jgi:pimeloyl-ACP methyl ester carboxylesterase
MVSVSHGADGCVRWIDFERRGASSGSARVTRLEMPEFPVTHEDCRPVSAPRITRHRIVLHGQPMSYLTCGPDDGPLVVLVHGLAGSAASWRDVLPLLGRHVSVLAPDLLGHGESAAPTTADYSVGGHAARLRDLLAELGHDRVSLVGHSFGGGVAMMFAYQFPERTETLTLVASGGLGPELSLALRSASLPGVALAAHALASVTPSWLGRLAAQGAVALGLAPRTDLDQASSALVDLLADPSARRAFLSTLRAAVGWSGQRLDATDLLYLLSDLPLLFIAGSRDACIPCHHTVRAHEALPGSQFALLPGGHFPHLEHPRQVVHLLIDFLTASLRLPPSAPAQRCSGARCDGRAAQGRRIPR